MKLLAYLRSLAARFFHRSQIEDDLEEELRAHIEHRTDDLKRSGLDRAEAERRAHIEFGGHERFKEESREALGGNFIETLIKDVRFSLRVLRKSRGFTIVAVLTLALAIGANAVVFSVLNALILRPLNVPRAESLYTIEHGSDKSLVLSYPDYLDLRDRNRSFEGLAAYNNIHVGLDTGDGPSRSRRDTPPELPPPQSVFGPLEPDPESVPPACAATPPRSSPDGTATAPLALSPAAIRQTGAANPELPH